MLDIKLLREESEKVKKGIAAKNADPKIVDEFLVFDARWRELTAALDEKRSEQKKLSAERKIDEAKKNKDKIKELEAKLKDIEAKRESALVKIPNPPLGDAPIGKSEADNVVLREVGEKTRFDFRPQDYFDLAERLGFIDTVRAAKVSGSRFGYLMGPLVQLEFAMMQFAIDVITNREKLSAIAKKNGLDVRDTPFIPVIPPVLINHKSMAGMGYLDRSKDEVYRFDEDGLYLVGTSEQALGPMHQGEIFNEEELPRRYAGFSACFRREAGSYGKDTRGILRVHQFNKLEMFSFAAPVSSLEEHKFLLAIEEYLMQALRLPYRVLNICTADLGDPAAAKFDVEVWMPGQRDGQGEYRETHSTSNTTDFQSRRLQIRYRPRGSAKASELLHMLNGTAFSERPLLAIIENYQTKDGKVGVPEALQKYVGKKIIG